MEDKIFEYELEDNIDTSDCLDDDDDYCYECRWYDDDYYIDDDGEMVCRCGSCTHNPNNWEDGYWIGDDDY